MAARVLTIGYGGTDADRFFAALRAAGATRLVDVRGRTRSNKKEFKGSRLRARCDAEGMEYVHLPACGAPRALRDPYLVDGDWATFARGFAVHLDHHAEAIDALEAQVTATDVNAALMCVCRDPERCHRSLLAERLLWRDHAVEHLWP